MPRFVSRTSGRRRSHQYFPKQKTEGNKALGEIPENVSEVSQSKPAYIHYQNFGRRDCAITFSYPDFTVGSGLSPDPATVGSRA